MKNAEVRSEMKVKIVQHADFKYNNRRAGEVGEIKDVYASDSTGDVVAEVEFGGDRCGYELCRPEDLELIQ